MPLPVPPSLAAPVAAPVFVAPRASIAPRVASTIAPAPLSSPLKWAGGKGWMADTLRTLYAPFRDRRLVEPFVGGLSVALALCPAQAWLGDGNDDLIRLYREMQQGYVPRLAFENDEATYYAVRRDFNAGRIDGSASERGLAEMFLYLNRTCHRGLSRYNSAGEFNVPYGHNPKACVPPDVQRSFQAVLGRWDFSCGDFEQTPTRPGDFVYVDPPFDGVFAAYTKDKFPWKDQVRLADWLDRHDGPIVASNSGSERVRELYAARGFTCRHIAAPKRGYGKREGAPIPQEMLATRGF